MNAALQQHSNCCAAVAALLLLRCNCCAAVDGVFAARCWPLLLMVGLLQMVMLNAVNGDWSDSDSEGGEDELAMADETPDETQVKFIQVPKFIQSAP